MLLYYLVIFKLFFFFFYVILSSPVILLLLFFFFLFVLKFRDCIMFSIRDGNLVVAVLPTLLVDEPCINNIVFMCTAIGVSFLVFFAFINSFAVLVSLFSYLSISKLHKSAGISVVCSSSFSQENYGVSHLGVVLDGNRRYGKATGDKSFDIIRINQLCTSILSASSLDGLSTSGVSKILEKIAALKNLIRSTYLDGYRVGAEKISELIEICTATNISMLTVYAFSKENWKRSAVEVNVLMTIFVYVFFQFKSIAEKHGVFVRFVTTDTSPLPISLLELMKKVENETRAITPRNLVLNILMSYSGQEEIVNACNALVCSRLGAKISDPVTVDEFKRKMLESVTQSENQVEDSFVFAKSSAEPDLIIRTGGDFRISNFLLFESAYSEFIFTSKNWPEFSQSDFLDALHEYSIRERRKGK